MTQCRCKRQNAFRAFLPVPNLAIPSARVDLREIDGFRGMWCYRLFAGEGELRIVHVAACVNSRESERPNRMPSCGWSQCGFTECGVSVERVRPGFAWMLR